MTTSIDSVDSTNSTGKATLVTVEYTWHNTPETVEAAKQRDSGYECPPSGEATMRIVVEDPSVVTVTELLEVFGRYAQMNGYTDVRIVNTEFEDGSLPNDQHKFVKAGEPYPVDFGLGRTSLMLLLRCKVCGFEADGIGYRPDADPEDISRMSPLFNVLDAVRMNQELDPSDRIPGTYALGSAALESTCRYQDHDDMPWEFESLKECVEEEEGLARELEEESRRAVQEVSNLVGPGRPSGASGLGDVGDVGDAS